jgi:hypothetical protein
METRLRMPSTSEHPPATKIPVGAKLVLEALERTNQDCGAVGYLSDLPVKEWCRSTRFGPIGVGQLYKSGLDRNVMKEYTLVSDWPIEHIPSRVPGAREKWAGLRAAVGVA